MGSALRIALKPGMHLAADRAAMRPRLHVGRQQARLGLDFVQVFADRQRVPDLDAAVQQRRHPHRGRQQQDFGLHGRVVGRDHLFGELQPGELRHQPAAQGPGAVVLAADGEDGLGHVRSSPGLPRPRTADARKVCAMKVHGWRATCLSQA
jgi:hypothetical protein